MDFTLFIVIIILIGSIYYLFTLVKELKTDIKQMSNTCFISNKTNTSAINDSINTSAINDTINTSAINDSINTSANIKPIIEFLKNMKELFSTNNLI